MESRSAAGRKQEQSEGAYGMPFFQQRQRTTASGRPPKDGWLFKFAQPASQAPSPLFSPSEYHHHYHDPSSQIHSPGTKPPRDYIKLSTHESHYHLQEKEQLAFPETSLPQVKPEREFMGDKQGNAYEGRGLVEIEQLLKQKMFTRDETNCLIELLRSRTIDLPYVDGHASKIAAEAVEARSQRDAITLKPQNNAFQPDQVTINVYDRLQSTDNREVGSSPVDIAKAYMQALASTSGTQNQSGRPRTEKIQCNDDESRLPFSTAINTPTQLHGAVVQGALGYCTPQTQRGSVVLRNFARNPYAHTPVSRSISKFQDGGRSPKVSMTGWKQSCTPLFGAKMTMKRKSSVLDDDLKSIGTTPRLARQKNIASTTLYRAGLSDAQKSLPYFSENFEILEGNASIFQRNVEYSSSKGSKGNLMMSQPSDRDENRPAFISGSSTVHPQSSEIARKILDHINRTVPSPKEKALELKTAITRTVVHSDSTTLISDSKENPPVVNSPDNQSVDCLVGRASSAQESVDTLEVPARPSSRQSVGKDLLSSCPQGTPFAVRSAEPWPHFSAHESGLKAITDSILGEEPKLSDESSKPSDDGTLTIIDNVSGFTFPIPVDSVASSEPPPTPTLFSFVATGMKNNMATEGIPSFTFGSRGAGIGPVFSFAAISSNANIDTTSPKFHFGSNNKCLSFMLLDKDTVGCV